MAKKRKGSKRPVAASSGARTEGSAARAASTEARPATAARLAARPAAPAAATDAEARSFWFGYEIAWAKLVCARVVIFGLLAIDALLQISHAPRYGAGGFNVAHVPLLDGIGPGRASFAIGELLVAYLLVLVACGVVVRVALPVATAIYAWLYFGSQLDSYQHHYLVALVLLIACFVPWQRPAGATPSTPVRAWGIRLVLVQLGIMYLWAAISKLDPAWLDGRTLEQQIAGPVRTLIDDTVGVAAASRFTVILELVLAVTIWWKRAWFVALPLGVAFHAGILASGLEIGLFAVLMLGFYVLVIPDRVFAVVGEHVRGLAGGRARGSERAHAVGAVRGTARPHTGRAIGGIARALDSWVVVAIAFAASIAVAFAVHLPFALAVGLTLAGACAARIAVELVVRAPSADDEPADPALDDAPAATETSRREGSRDLVPGDRTSIATSAPRRWTFAGRLVRAHLAAMLVWLAVDRASATAVDYYRFWGGNARRLGDPEASERAYRSLIDIAPDEPAGHYQLGRILLGRGDEAAGLAELHAAQRLEPARARAFLAEAEYLRTTGRVADAIEKAKAAAAAEPGHAGAQRLVQALTGQAGPGSARAPDDGDEER